MTGDATMPDPADRAVPTAPAQYYVVLMTTAFASIAEVGERAPEALAAHLARSKALHAEGRLLMAGAFLDRPDEPVQTMGIFGSREDAEAYVGADPFAVTGQVSEWNIRVWANMLR